MRIIVPIKQIQDPGGITVRRDKERLFINREEYIIGPGSKAALEAALHIKDKDLTEIEVLALSMGPERVDDALREALAMGCDAAYRLTDDAFEGADPSVAARVLAAAIDEMGGADLVVAGRESGDTGAGQIGSRLAEALGYSQVINVLDLEAGIDAVQATRPWQGGYAAVTASFPAVVTVAPNAFSPRYAHGARIMNAYRDWDVTVWDATRLGLGEAALTPFLALHGESFPPPLPVGEEFTGDPASLGQEVVMMLRLQKLVG
jgi:electron transfer flavoprotein beta subunit